PDSSGRRQCVAPPRAGRRGEMVERAWRQCGHRAGPVFRRAGWGPAIARTRNAAAVGVELDSQPFESPYSADALPCSSCAAATAQLRLADTPARPSTSNQGVAWAGQLQLPAGWRTARSPRMTLCAGTDVM